MGLTLRFMVAVAALVAALIAPVAPSQGARAGETAPRAPDESALPGCPAGRARCLGLVLAIAEGEAGPVQSRAWVSDQLAEANRHFAPLDVGFEVAEFRALSSDRLRLDTREDRDALGTLHPAAPGAIHVYVVERIADIDRDDAEIRGVHWRERTGKGRWIILSRIAPAKVLAHELGHYFGLPHSKHPGSIMNKTIRLIPSPSTWTFVDSELRTMRRTLRALLKSRELVSRQGR